MATEVLLVKAGMTMTEGSVAEWYVPDGGTVERGQLLYRMETEKIELEVEAEASGIVRHVAPEGTSLVPGALIAYILAPGEAPPPGLSPACRRSPPMSEVAKRSAPVACRTGSRSPAHRSLGASPRKRECRCPPLPVRVQAAASPRVTFGHSWRPGWRRRRRQLPPGPKSQHHRSPAGWPSSAASTCGW